MLNLSTPKRSARPTQAGGPSCPAPRPNTAWSVGIFSLFLILLFTLAAGSAFAGGYGGTSCPSIHNLQPANGCSSYTVTIGCNSQGQPTATFTCWNSQPANGDCVTGFAAYWIGPGDCKPICQTAPSNCQTTSYGPYCQSVWDYNCYAVCSTNCNTTGGSTGGNNCGYGSTGGSSGGTNCGSTGGTNCGSTGGTNCGYGSTGGYGCYGLTANCSGTTGGSSGGTNCGGSTGGNSGCWYNQCGWLPQGCVTPGNCTQPKCFTLTYPCGTKLCASDFCCGVHCYQQSGCDYWCMCGQQNLGALSVSATPVCITNTETTQLSYVVKNTGTGNVNSVVVKDNFGTVAPPASFTGTLAAGASVTFTRTITNQNTTFTDDISATGTDTNNSQVNAGTAIAVDVVHPALTLTASAGQVVNNQVTVTYTLTNTGDDTINNITITGYVNGTPTVLKTIASLAPGAPAVTVTQTITITGPTSVYAVASGTDSCSSVPISVTSTTVQPQAQITGSVSCANCTCPIGGATVQLINATTSAVVATTTTSSSGGFTFLNEPSGTYSIAVTDSPNYNAYTGTSFAFNSSGEDYNAGTIGLTAAPISYLSQQGNAQGQVFFASAADFQSYGITIGTTPCSDLTNPSFVSTSTAYPYTGTIPEFPELGSFSGNIYVVMVQPLVNPNVWTGTSFVNQVAVFDVWPTLPSGTEGAPGEYIDREIFNQPFTGPGTATNYTLSGLNFTVPSPAPAYTVTPEPLQWTGGGTTPPTPAAGTLPAGWMAQYQLSWMLPPFASWSFTINGSYNDICGDNFSFSICPTGSNTP